MTGRVERMHARLAAAFPGADILIKDQSHLHAGHAEAQDGRGHYDLRIVSDRFSGASRIQRHKMVYDALGDMMQSDIHALRIKAQTDMEL